MRALFGLILAFGLLAASASAQTGVEELHIAPPVSALKAALITATEGGDHAEFERLLLTEKVYVAISEASYRSLLAAREAGDPGRRTWIEYPSFRIDGAPQAVLIFTSAEDLKAVIGDRYWANPPGRQVLSALPVSVPVTVMDDQGHQASFTAEEVRILLGRPMPAASGPNSGS